MKKSIVIGLSLFLVIFMLSAAAAFGPFGGKKEEEKKPDVDNLSKRAVTLINNVQSATISFAEGVVLIQIAIGFKEEAEKLQQSIKNAKEKKGDMNATKQLVGDVNNATASLNKVDLSSQMNKEKASETLNDSILRIGVGIILDGMAVKNAGDLLQEAQAALSQVSWTAAGKVKEIIDVAQFVAQEIPPQINNLKQYSEKLYDYAKTNGIPTPSQDDIKKKADAMAEG